MQAEKSVIFIHLVDRGLNCWFLLCLPVGSRRKKQLVDKVSVVYVIIMLPQEKRHGVMGRTRTSDLTA
jgi:hypothetical protein